MLRLLGGMVLWVTTLYCGPKTRSGKGRGREGGGLYPELALLGFSEGSSPALVSRVGRLTALLPSYAQAQQELATEGVSLGIKVVHRIGKQLGAEALAARTEQLQRYRAGALPAGKELKGKRVGAASDGGRIRIRTVIRKQKGCGRHKKCRRRFQVEWREPKLLVIFELDAQGRMRRGSRSWIDGTFGGPDEVMELLAMHLHRLGAAQAKQVVFLSDGAPWIWDRLDWVTRRVGIKTKRVEKVLDCCHAVHHLSLALEAAKLDAPTRQYWYRKLRKLLRAGQTSRVLRQLLTWAHEQLNDAPIWTHYHYLERHHEQGHMDYARFRRHGIPQGSGAIESAVRRVINLRLKGNGILWQEENAEAVLVLRAAVLTGRWQEMLEQVRLRSRSDRRLDWTWESPDMPAQLKAQLPITPPTPQPQLEQAHKAIAA